MEISGDGESGKKLDTFVLQTGYRASGVGEISLSDKEPRCATVEAVTDCEFVCIDETAGCALDVMRALANRCCALARPPPKD
jgi:hypothetical protein